MSVVAPVVFAVMVSSPVRDVVVPNSTVGDRVNNMVCGGYMCCRRP